MEKSLEKTGRSQRQGGVQSQNRSVFLMPCLSTLAGLLLLQGCIVAGPVGSNEYGDGGPGVFGDTVSDQGSDDGTDSVSDTESGSETGSGSDVEWMTDGCPDDENKMDPGACGCGVPDEDGDGDGVLDCEDLCPADPEKIEPGECDCGIPEGLCRGFTSLKDASGEPTGVVDFKLSGGSLNLYVDGDYDSGGWILIGRGREGWAWSEDGLGDSAALYDGLGTPAAFEPAYLSTAVIQELLDNTQVDLQDVQIRIKRAAATDGGSYQETIWRSQTSRGWTWLFDSVPFDIQYTVHSSVLGDGLTTSGNTRDVGANDHRRTFTFSWSEHVGKRGFSYGSTIQSGTNDSDNFLWQNGVERHSIPYSEVYIRLSPRHLKSCLEIFQGNSGAPDGTYGIDPDGDGSTVEVECDMTGGGWTVLYREDFSSGSPSGWQDGAGGAAAVDNTSNCATAYTPMLGGFNHFGVGAQAVQTFGLLGIAHAQISLALDYICIDSWDSESAIVNVDGSEQYRAPFDTTNFTENVCGGGWADAGVQKVSIVSAHTGNTVTVQVTSSLNQAADDESFGVDNVVLKIK